ncbi:NUDIX hydrolase [Yunchengibacter salinarum]|uniref:NUDIX hydrolase n=1 Tax=Yunchengibacter salinarum TaxID=3133399 RepID=UPI0035B5AA92
MSDTPVPKRFDRRVPHGDDLERLVCDNCGFVHYENPKIITGAVVTFEDRFLLVRRAIEPRYGFWTIPAGYMELNETPEQGAAREAMEEACAAITVQDLLAVYTVQHISQVHMMYRAKLKEPSFAPGVESLEAQLFRWDAIPWDDLAFPTVHWVLKHYREVSDKAAIAPFGNPEPSRPPKP